MAGEDGAAGDEFVDVRDRHRMERRLKTVLRPLGGELGRGEAFLEQGALVGGSDGQDVDDGEAEAERGLGIRRADATAQGLGHGCVPSHEAIGDETDEDDPVGALVNQGKEEALKLIEFFGLGEEVQLIENENEGKSRLSGETTEELEDGARIVTPERLRDGEVIEIVFGEVGGAAEPLGGEVLLVTSKGAEHGAEDAAGDEGMLFFEEHECLVDHVLLLFQRDVDPSLVKLIQGDVLLDHRPHQGVGEMAKLTVRHGGAVLGAGRMAQAADETIENERFQRFLLTGWIGGVGVENGVRQIATQAAIFLSLQRPGQSGPGCACSGGSWPRRWPEPRAGRHGSWTHRPTRRFARDPSHQCWC